MRIIRAILPAWVGLAAMLMAAPTIAADAETPPPEAAPALAPGWTFTLEPFFWAASLDGSVGVRGLGPANVSINFDQIWNHIDWSPPPVMIDGEARYGRYALFSEFIYLGLEAEGSTPGPLHISASEELNLYLWTFGGSYRVADNGTATLDVLAGGRLWSLDSDLTISGPRAVREASGSKTWVDPADWFGQQYCPRQRLWAPRRGRCRWLRRRADIDWQVLGTLQYKFNDSVMVEAGYRYLAVDYANGGFVWDVAMQGPVIGVNFRF